MGFLFFEQFWLGLVYANKITHVYQNNDNYIPMKVFNIVFCILFIISAGLQYNDVDPYLWIPLYGYGAWACYTAARGRNASGIFAIGVVGYLAFAVYYLIFKHGVLEWFQFHETRDLVHSMKADKPWIEETREVMGLMILAVVMAINWIVVAKRQRNIRA